jgi:hypothetical protein
MGGAVRYGRVGGHFVERFHETPLRLAVEQRALDPKAAGYSVEKSAGSGTFVELDQVEVRGRNADALRQLALCETTAFA